MNKLIVFFIILCFNQKLMAQYEPVRIGKDSLILVDGKIVTQAQYDKDNFFRPFLLGTGYSIHQPKGDLGVFSGLSLGCLIWGLVGLNENWRASHRRFYVKLDYLSSNKAKIDRMYKYAIGMDRSWQKNPRRAYLVPCFGIEMGGIYQKQIGYTGHCTPTLGMHIIAKEKLFINISGGYVYTFKHTDQLKGYLAQLNVHFQLPKKNR